VDGEDKQVLARSWLCCSAKGKPDCSEPATCSNLGITISFKAKLKGAVISGFGDLLITQFLGPVCSQNSKVTLVSYFFDTFNLGKTPLMSVLNNVNLS
jgi:hypothetical protein